MEEKRLSGFFESYLKKKPLFKDKKVLQSNYTPNKILHRDEQIDQVAGILAPSLRMEKPSNIFIYGKSGCIAGNSLVYTNNGWKKIENVDVENDLVLSFDIKNKRYEWSNFVFLKFENKDKLLKITLDDGKELVVTKDHPLLLSNMEWKKSDELNKSDELVLSYDLPNLSNEKISLEAARLLGFVIGDGSLNKRERRIKDSRGNWYNANIQRCRFFSEDDILLNMFKKDLSELFIYTPRIIYPTKYCRYVNVVSQEICRFLNNYDIPFGKKSSVIQIPSIVLESSNVIQREFLRALFSCDGTVSQHTYMIEYYSNSKKLLQQISCLLYQEGISCKIRKKIAGCNGKLFDSFRLYICGQENLVKFSHKIGFYGIKEERLKKMLNKYVKNMGLYNKNYKVSRIINIEETYEPYVYDLTVPKNHNFIANGIISHNSGKTCVVKYVTKEIEEMAEKKKLPIKIFYLNCKLKRVADTEYRLIAQLNREFGEDVPATGLPTDEVYKIFINSVEKKKILLVIVLDEIDQLVLKTGDGILYNLTRLNSELKKSQIVIIGISNDLLFTDSIDPRVKSSLSEEEIHFHPYNALQLQKILHERARIGFRKGVVEEGLIEKCAAYAAREHGDARRALELLRVGGELSERKGLDMIKISCLDEAERKIEKDRVLEVVKTQPKQCKLALHSIFTLCLGKEKPVFTGDIYEIYKDSCFKSGVRPLTQRRLSDIIAELDMLGIINAKVISKGRYGRTREIQLGIPSSTVQKIHSLLRESLEL